MLDDPIIVLSRIFYLILQFKDDYEIVKVYEVNFFFFMQSKEECKYLIGLAKPHMIKSTVVDSDTGKSKDSRYAKRAPSRDFGAF